MRPTVPAVLSALALGLGLLAVAAPAAASTFPLRDGLYQVRPDARLCPSPFCGGYWIRAVNHARTTCADGTVASWCYVMDIDWTGAGWDPADVNRYLQSVGTEPMLVFGRQTAQATPFGTFGRLTPAKAFSAFPAP